MAHWRTSLLATALFWFAGCTDGSAPVDGSVPLDGALPIDAGSLPPHDASADAHVTPDGDVPDADGTPDSGIGDASVPMDAGLDAGIDEEPPFVEDPPVGVPDDLPPGACEQNFIDEGAHRACASCVCGRCEDPVAACAGGSNPDGCRAVVACQTANGCTGLDCFCGSSIACAITPTGPCIDVYRSVSGLNTRAQFRDLFDDAPAGNPLIRANGVSTCALAADVCTTQCGPDGAECGFDDESCQERYCSVDEDREAARLASAQSTARPRIDRVRVNGAVVWSRGGGGAVPNVSVGQEVVLEGTGFGAGTDVDFSKIMIGNSRVLETDLSMYTQKINILTQVHYETAETHSTWDSDIVSWTDTRIAFHVPIHASGGPIRVQVQKRIGNNPSLTQPGVPHLVVNAQTLRITDPAFEHTCDVVSELSQPRISNEVPVTVSNPGFAGLAQHGRSIFWSFDYNIGLSHALRNLDWEAILGGEAIDPIANGVADPYTLFGAYPTVAGEVPSEAIDDVLFDPYPQRTPIPGLLAVGSTLLKGNTRDTGYVGYRYAEANHPYSGKGEWIGFNCASCHGYRVEYDRAPGQHVARVIPGLPNPMWTMKWTILGEFDGIVDDEEGPTWAPGVAAIDKTTLIYAMPPGAGEHNIVRLRGEGSHTDNDYQFSPIAIPNVTHYMPIRRSLSHTESYVGFEGSYIHSEEPDGALGSMRAEQLQALTAYMTTLDANDDDLRNVGVYRWLDARGEADTLTGNASEGAFVQAGWESYSGVAARVADGRETFNERCGSCHGDGLDAHSNERMMRLDEVGHFFAPTIYQRHTQSVRVSFLRDMYFTQHRGLLSDGHVRNLEDLVHPDRCTEGTALYDRYYTLHAPTAGLPSAGPGFPAPQPGGNPRGDVFRMIRSSDATATGQARNLFIERHKYFVTVPWDPGHYYWDYQAMRTQYGPDEIGTAGPIGMPAAPHPWCAGSASEVANLVLYVLTL